MDELKKENKSAHWHSRGVFYIFVVVVCALAVVLAVGNVWVSAMVDIEASATVAVVSGSAGPVATPREKTARQTVKAVYLTAYSAGNPKKIDEIINLIDTTELNAVVLDIKDYTGYVLYDSDVPLVKKLHTKKVLIRHLPEIIRKLHDHKIYVIARQTIMQDPVLGEVMPGWAILNHEGVVWRDKKGLSWVDPTRREVWGYNVAIAKEAIALGFDEINFDYVRFPSDGDLSAVVYNNGASARYEVMGEFYKYLSDRLKMEPALISLDMFGFVMEKKGTDDMHIGQRLADAVGNTDYVCPMMYPSHYPVGHLGFANPAEHPGAVIEHGMQEGMHYFDGARAEARPWIQAFNLGAVYDAGKIREQIDAVEKYSSAGWLMWNASNRYSDAGLKAE